MLIDLTKIKCVHFIKNMQSQLPEKYYDEIVVVAAHSRVIRPKPEEPASDAMELEEIDPSATCMTVQKPIPPGMTVTNACLVNETLYASNLPELFVELNKLYKCPRFVKMSASSTMASRCPNPPASEINAELSKHRAKSCFGAASLATNGRVCMNASKFTQTDHEAPLTLQSFFLDGAKSDDEGIWLINGKTTPPQDITASILGPPIRRPDELQFYHPTNEMEKEIIKFERWFVSHKRQIPTDVEVIDGLLHHVAKQNPMDAEAKIKIKIARGIVSLRDNRYAYLTAIDLPTLPPMSFSTLCEYDVEDLEKLRMGIRSEILKNEELLTKKHTPDEVKRIIWDSMTKELQTNVAKIFPFFVDDVVKKMVDSNTVVDTKNLKCRYDSIQSDVLLNMIRAKFPPSHNIYVLFIGCRMDDPTCLPMHTPRPKGSTLQKFKSYFKGGKRRNTKTSKRIKRIKTKTSKKNVNRRSHRK